MKKLIEWFNQWGLYVATLFLLTFIPLYPKLPLIDIRQTWVYIRLEDFLVAAALILLLIQLLRMRRVPDGSITLPIFVYWGIGLLSLVHALVFIFPSFQGIYFSHLAVLHYLRRIEYMGLFFVAYEAFRKKPLVTPLLIAISTTFALVILYGIGQKFLGWPAFLTMNEEFAKGVPLRLPGTARIPSTFSGHYDLAAYLVLMIPVIGSMIFGVKVWWQKIIYSMLALVGLIVLLFTASRISFGVYLIAVSVMLWWQKKPLLIPLVIIASIVILNITSGASERFYKTFRVSNVVVDLSTGKPIGTLDKIEGKNAVLEKIEELDRESLPKGSGFINLPSTDTTSTTPTPKPIQTVEVFTSKGVATGSGEVATISGSFLIQKALVYDISITTRFQGQWPKAVAAFKRNILLGSGYSTLSVAADGDYHRMLGETGLLGTIAFLGVFAASFALFLKSKDKLKSLTRSLVIGLYAGIVGLLINATLIDVFEASKIAFTLWLLLGVATALCMQTRTVSIPYLKLLKNIFTHPIAYALYITIVIVFVWHASLSGYFIGDDFTWLRWAAESSKQDIIAYFTNSSGFFYRPIPKLWYFVLFSTFWLKPFAYHAMSLLLVIITTLLLYQTLLYRGVKRVVAWTGAIYFATLSVNHEVVFWISCHSHLLSAVGLTASIACLLKAISVQGKTQRLLFVFVQLFLVLSMLSYDAMAAAPLIIWLIGIVFGKRKGLWHATLLWIPIYIIIHALTHAVGPEGDYGYKLTTFLPNAVGNTIGYIIAIVGGPQVMDMLAGIRLILRGYIVPIFIMSMAGVISGIILLWKKRNIIASYQETGLWIICFLLSLSAYFGLGNISERYAFIPAWFLVAAIIMAFHITYMRLKHSVLVIAAEIMFLGFMIIYNIQQINRVSGDWKQASEIVQQSLLAIKQETFPPKNAKTFVFINTPIKYGRAWIYPTGLTDALWHIYRQTPFIVYTATSLKEAYGPHKIIGDLEVFVFDGYILKRGLKETQMIENQ